MYRLRQRLSVGGLLGIFMRPEEEAYRKEKQILDLFIEGLRTSKKPDEQKAAVREALKDILPPEWIEGMIVRFIDRPPKKKK